MEESRYAVVYLKKIQGVASSTSQAVYIYLSKYANKEGMCCPSIGYIAKCTCKSRSTVQRALKELEGLGAIRIKYNNGGSNIYTVLRRKLVKM